MEKLEYLSDEELEAMIQEVEQYGMMEAPVQMKEKLLQVLQQEETIQRPQMSEWHKKRSMLIYSMKVSLTAAAAILCVIFMPLQMQQRQTGVQPKTSVTRQMKEASTHICEKMQNLSERLMFSNEMEER